MLARNSRLRSTRSSLYLRVAASTALEGPDHSGIAVKVHNRLEVDAADSLVALPVERVVTAVSGPRYPPCHVVVASNIAHPAPQRSTIPDGTGFQRANHEPLRWALRPSPGSTRTSSYSRARQATRSLTPVAALLTGRATAFDAACRSTPSYRPAHHCRVVPLAASSKPHVCLLLPPAARLIAVHVLALSRTGSTTAQAASTASSRVKSAPSPAIASPKSRSSGVSSFGCSSKP